MNSLTQTELKEIREHMERCYTGLNDSAFDDVVRLIAHIDHLQTALDAANKRAEAAEKERDAAVHDIKLLMIGCTCRYSCHVCANGDCSNSPNCRPNWRGQEGE